MSTLTEIEEAIERLPVAEREALEARLVAHRFGLDSLEEAAQEEVLKSLETSRQQVLRGEGLSGEDIRVKVQGWLGR